jgi:hypothetical protein
MISLICPTRGRVENVRKMINDFRNTQTNQNELWFYIQDDDTSKNDYIKLFKEVNHKEYMVDRFTFTGHMWTILAGKCKGDIIMLMGDDAGIVTKGWDIKMEEAAKQYNKDNIFFMGVKDERGKHPFPAMSRTVFNLLGFFYAPQFLHRYGDTYLVKLGQEIERFIVVDVLFRHPKGDYAEDTTGKKSRQWTWFDKHSWEKSDRYFKADVELLRSNLKQ